MSQIDTSKQYKTILEYIQEENYNKSNAYVDLIAIESNVLNTINRVSEFEAKKNIEPFIYNKSIRDILFKFSNTWNNIFTEIFIEKKIKSLGEIFLEKDRKIYVGIMIILIAIVFILAIIS